MADCNKYTHTYHGVTCFQSPEVQERFNILEELAEDFNIHPDVSFQYLAEHTAVGLSLLTLLD